MKIKMSKEQLENLQVFLKVVEKLEDEGKLPHQKEYIIKPDENRSLVTEEKPSSAKIAQVSTVSKTEQVGEKPAGEN